jgi:sec-independent protein translocase protein TatA
MGLGIGEIVVLLVVALLLFGGYKKLPDASRSIGRSLRIFKGEMKGLKDDDVRAKDPATTTPVRGEVVADPAAARLAEEAAAAEARAAELRARAERARAAEGPR